MLFLKSPFEKKKNNNNNNNNLKSKPDYNQTSIHKAASVWEGHMVIKQVGHLKKVLFTDT